MPTRTISFTITPTTTDVRDSYHITAFHVVGPIVDDLSPAAWVQVYNRAFDPTDSSEHNVYLMWATDYEVSDGASGWLRRLRWHRYDLIDLVDTELVSIDAAVTTAVDLYAASEFISTRSIGDDTDGGSRAATDIGHPVVVWTYHPFRPDTVNDVYMFPNPTTVATDITDTPLNTSLYAGRLVAHQSRVVSTTRQAWGFGDVDAIQDCGWLSWSKPNDSNQEAIANYFEGPYSVGAWASMTASDLIIISTFNGAILIQGDLNAPTVRHLPSVTPTYGIETSGAVTPVGFVYGTNRHGVHLWAGGSGSQCLSPHLPGDFFFSPSLTLSPVYKGQFAHWGEWIMAPYNWAFHIETESWWRIDDPAELDIAFWFPSPCGTQLYGAPGSFPAAPNNPYDVAHSYAPDHLASSYRWESQVIIPESINRLVSIREVTLLADGPGTITVTITGLNDTSATPLVFTLSDTGPQLEMKREIALDAAGIVVRIDADSESDDLPAPLVLELSIGYQPTTQAVVAA